MAKKSKKKKKPAEDPNEKVVTENRKARHRYEVLDTLECGIVLHGSEVKSLRNGHVSLEESYARVKKGEVWLVGADIPEYTEASRMNHTPKRPRKLLLHRHELDRLTGAVERKGYALVPLDLHWHKGRAKLAVGLAKGKKQVDKRQTIKERDWNRDKARLMRERG